MAAAWYFPPLLGGQESGLNEPGIEFFRKLPGSLARETVQNSGDAALEGMPARITFTLMHVATAEVPGHAELARIIERCEDYCLSPCKSQKERKQNGSEYFARAKKLLEAKTLPILRIRDENTSGLTGDDVDNMSPWYRLIRKQGSAAMHGAGGGTYGIGQRAPFAFSGLRTILYGTRTSGGVRFIGKSILSSHRHDGAVFQPIGYWGEKSGSANSVHVASIQDDAIVPAWMRRATVGTDVFVLGYVQSDWMTTLTNSVLQSFFAGILARRLVVTFEDQATGIAHTIDHANLLDYVATALSASRAAAANGTVAMRNEVEEGLGLTDWYLKALTAPLNGSAFTTDGPLLGKMQLFVHRADNAPSKVAYMRRPMILVFDRTSNVLSGYSAVFICENQEGNDRLAALEDPSHTKWDRSAEGGGAILAEVGAFVRSTLTTLSQEDPTKVQDLPDLGQYLPEDVDATATKARGGAKVSDKRQKEPETTRSTRRKGKKAVAARPRPAAEPAVAAEEVSKAGQAGAGDAGASGGGGVGGGQGTGEGGGGGGGGGGSQPGGVGGSESGEQHGELGAPGDSAKALRPNQLKFRTYFEPNHNATCLVARSTRQGVANLVVAGVGEDDAAYRLTLTSATDAETGETFVVDGSRIKAVHFFGNQRRVIRLGVSPPRRVALTVGVEHAD